METHHLHWEDTHVNTPIPELRVRPDPMQVFMFALCHLEQTSDPLQ